MHFLCLIVLVLGFANVGCVAQSEAFGSKAPHHRIMLPAGSPLLSVLQERQAVRSIDDYGSSVYVLVDALASGGATSLVAAGASLCDDDAIIGINGFPLNTSDPQQLARVLASIPSGLGADANASAAVFGPTATALYLVQFKGPIRDVWLDRLGATGVKVISYMPSNAYVVRVDGDSAVGLAALATDPIVAWIGPYVPWMKLSPELRRLVADGSGRADVVVSIINDQGGMGLANLLRATSVEEIRPSQDGPDFINLTLSLPVGFLRELSAHPTVYGIEAWVPERKFDEVQGQILAGQLNGAGTGAVAPGYLAWLASKGFNAAGQFNFVVDVTDDGIDRGDLVNINVEFRALGTAMGIGRLVYNHNYTSDPLADGGGGHGTLNASIIGGYNGLTGASFEDAGGYNYGLGVAPFVKLGNTKVFANSTGSTFTGSTPTRLNLAYANGARISSNSWGYTTGNSYTTDTQAHDRAVRDAQLGVVGNQELTLVFAAGNDGSGSNTVRPPSTGKNLIVVGAGESYRTTGTDGCGIGNTGANSAKDMIEFSSRGPCSDGRFKPDVVAPGTHIQGAASLSANYSGAGVCDPYWPLAQTRYTWSSGTSHATPGVAGASALVLQDSLNRGFGAPSPALIKAALMTTATHMTGVGANDTLPSPSQGLGRINLNLALNTTTPIVRVNQTQILGSTGEMYSMSGTVAMTTQPLRIGLVWTDVPGATTGSAWVNNLDLEVLVNGVLYRGNVFSGPSSITGGSADAKNNAEFVFLPAGVSGTVTVRVRATNIVGDGVPLNGDATDQDFALFAYNVAVAPPAPDFSVRSTPGSLSMMQGATTSAAISLNVVGGFSAPVSLSVAPAIAGVSMSLSTTTISSGGSSLLTVATIQSVTPGTYSIHVTGTSGALTRTTTLSLTVTPILMGATAKTYSLTPNLAIPDNNVVGITSVLAVPYAQVISSLSVDVQIPHTYRGDLTVTLVAPNGTSRILHNRTGGAAANVITTYSILTAPYQALAGFVGLTTQGNWQLRVTDTVASDVGTLVSWSLTFNGERTSSSTSNIIPDNSVTGTSKLIAFSESGVISTVRVMVGIAHGRPSDLVVTLRHPDGTTVTLHNRTMHNVSTVYPDWVVPAQSLGVLSGKSVTGTWTIKAVDQVTGTEGKLGLCVLSFRTP